MVGADHADACAPFGFGFAESALRSRASSAHGRPALYGNTTSTLNNIIPALFSSVTGCHSPVPSSVVLPIQNWHHSTNPNFPHPLDTTTPMAYNISMIFIETSLFTQRIVQIMDDDAYGELQEHLAAHPEAGPVIIGSGGVRKIRWRGSSRGKRGGSRLIYYWDNGHQILMLYAYLKNERENLTPEQISMMREIAKEFKHE